MSGLTEQIDAIPQPVGIDTLEKLSAWIAAFPRAQQDVSGPDPCLGEWFDQAAFAIDSEEEKANAAAAVVQMMAWAIHRVAMSAPGAILWRIRPEIVEEPLAIFTRYGEEGPDKNYSLDRRGWADRRFGIIRGYVRMGVLAALRKNSP